MHLDGTDSQQSGQELITKITYILFTSILETHFDYNTCFQSDSPSIHPPLSPSISIYDNTVI